MEYALWLHIHEYFHNTSVVSSLSCVIPIYFPLFSSSLRLSSILYSLFVSECPTIRQREAKWRFGMSKYWIGKRRTANVFSLSLQLCLWFYWTCTWMNSGLAVVEYPDQAQSLFLFSTAILASTWSISSSFFISQGTFPVLIPWMDFSHCTDQSPLSLSLSLLLHFRSILWLHFLSSIKESFIDCTPHCPFSLSPSSLCSLLFLYSLHSPICLLLFCHLLPSTHSFHTTFTIYTLHAAQIVDIEKEWERRTPSSVSLNSLLFLPLRTVFLNSSERGIFHIRPSILLFILSIAVSTTAQLIFFLRSFSR